MSAPMPTIVWEKLVAFVYAERTGQIVLDFKAGRLLGYKVTEYYRTGATDDEPTAVLDGTPRNGQDSPQTT